MTMMKHLVRFCLALLLAAGAAAPLAAQPGAEDPALREAERPFHALLRHRAELGLTEQQVARLSEIRADLERRNGPLRRELMTRHQRWREERRAQLERMSPQERRAELRRVRERPAGERVPADMQPIVRQMRGNIDQAMARAQSVLTADQRDRARTILRRELREGRRVAPRAGARGPAPRAEQRVERSERRAQDAERRAEAAERRAEDAERRARAGRQP